ncbi:hypothetical protein PG995_013648 [Apiospora arundinis]
MESRAAPICTSEVKTAAGRKKRALTQARREQNRVAQKIYREKQKKLRECVKSQEPRDAANGALLVELRPKDDYIASSSRIATASPFVSRGEKRRHAGGELPSPANTAPEQHQEEAHVDHNYVDSNLSFLAQNPVHFLGIDLSSGEPFQGNSTPDLTILQDDFFDSNVCTASITYDETPYLFGTEYTWEQQQQEGPDAATTSCSAVTNSPHNSSNNGNGTLMTSSSSLLSSSSAPSQGYFSAASSFFADPYANARPLSQTAIFSALLHNALALGFNLAALADCASPYACLSPFYRATATAQDDPHQLVADALTCIATHRRGMDKAATPSKGDGDVAVDTAVPASLRPTLAQILIPHHASLDLIPFPQFRDRVIMLSAALPHQFNLLELKRDIYVSGALRVATTAANGGGGRCTVGGRRSYQPWEPQSWEARGWFLKKWNLAIDDGSNEIGQAVA